MDILGNVSLCSVVKAAIMAAIANDNCCIRLNSRKKGEIYKMQYFMWLIMLALFSPHKKINSKKFIAVQTQVNEKRLCKYAENGEYFRFASLNRSVKQLKNNISVFSPYSLSERIRNLVRGFCFYTKNIKELRGNACFVLEYFAIAHYLSDNKIEQIITSGMYERYCTLLSYLGRGFGIEIVGVQDGAAVDINAPAGLYCDKMYVFDEFERNIVEKFIINDDCEFICTGFESTIKWTELKTEKRIIAIASQDWFTDKTILLADRVINSVDTDKNQIVVFPHPRERGEQYRELIAKYPDLIVTNERYSNIDLLITFYSTIVYDFWSVNPKLEVACVHIDGYEPSYYKRDNVTIYKNSDEIIARIKSKCS